MKKVYLFLFSIVLIAFLISGTVKAYDFEGSTGLKNTGTNAGYQEGSQFDLGLTVGKVIGILLGFIGVIFLVLMIYGGYIWMIARGNQAEVDKAKRLIEGAIIGLVILLSAYAISNFVMTSIYEGGNF